MNTIGNTSDKSCGHDLHPSENRQGMLAGLRPSSPVPPRAAAVAHQRLPTSLAQAHPPVGERLSPARATGQISATLFSEALEAPFGWTSLASVGESADLLDSLVNHLLSDDYEAYDPEDPNVRALMADYASAFPDTDVPPFGEALEAPSDRASLASVGESADLFDSVVNRLLSDDYEAYDPEDPNVRALMTDYEAAMLNSGAAPPAGPVHEHPPVGESPGTGSATGQLDATLPGGALDISSGGEKAKQPAEPLVDPDHVRGKMRVRGDYMPATDDQRQAILHIFKTQPEKTNRSIADKIGISLSTIQRLRKKYSKTGNLEPGNYTNRLTGDQRQAILHIFKTNPERSTQSLVDEFGTAYSTIHELKKKFDKTGNVKPGNHARRLTADQRQAILHIFKTEPERSNQSIADDFDVNLKTIQTSRKRFSKTGNLKPGDRANRLTDDQRRTILHVFKTEPERSNQSLVDEFGVAHATIQLLRKKFSRTGNIKPGKNGIHLTADQRRAILHIFETESNRSSRSIADEFGVSYITIFLLRRQFGKTGNLKPGDHARRLTTDQRRAILHSFETDPKRSNQSLTDEFGVTLKTIRGLRKQFGKTGNIKQRNSAYRLSDEQRQAILRIFEAEPERSNPSLADEFGVTLKTIRLFRERFSKTGDIKPADNRLSDEQRQAILRIFEAEPERSNPSLADEFSVTLKTIRLFRERFNKTGDIKPADNRLSDEQRQAILRIFEAEPERSNPSLADEFDVTIRTIRSLRKQFSKTGDIKRGDSANRLTGEQRRAILHIFETDPERKNESIADEFRVTMKTIRTLRTRFSKT